MKDKLFSIGSIVKKSDKTLCIVGYADAEIKGERKYGYYVVLYPMGYIGAESLLFIDAESEMTLISGGYETESSKANKAFTEGVFAGLKKAGPEKAKVFYENIAKMEEKNNG